MYTRESLKLIIDKLSWKKVIIIYGARQVGKTTLCKKLMSHIGEEKCIYINCERLSVREVLEKQNILEIISMFQGKQNIFLDEAQLVNDIGRVLKIIHDTHPDLQIIATGSSAFDSNNRLSEPLTGRNIKFILYPLSVREVNIGKSSDDMFDILNKAIRFGLYPDIVDKPDLDSIERLDYLSGDYLYKDILALDNIKKPDLLRSLLKALALQIGNEVNYHELAKLLSTSSETIYRYLDLLEKSFIIYRLKSFSRNMRNELKKGFKVYFYDLGIRNGMLGDYKNVENRGDIGALFENFCVIERIKQIQANREYGNLYFWRTYTPDKEIDLIEERDGIFYTYEFKWNAKASGNARLPKNFLEAYGKNINRAGEDGGDCDNIVYQTIDSSNWWQWLMK